MRAERTRRRLLPLASTLLCVVSTGCWEQYAPQWFAQMKEQPAVQALEGVRPLDPPPGTIPFGGIEPRIDSPVPAFMPAAAALVNPVEATPDSVERGKYVFDIYCAVCHGSDGMADPATTPVAARLAARSPQMTPPKLSAVPGYTDGFLFTKIRYGRPVMPGYPQIPARDRWHVVNYLRTLIPGGS